MDTESRRRSSSGWEEGPGQPEGRRRGAGNEQLELQVPSQGSAVWLWLSSASPEAGHHFSTGATGARPTEDRPDLRRMFQLLSM